MPRSLTGISRHTFGSHQLKQHLQSTLHENVLDELRVSGSFLLHSDEIQKTHNLAQPEDTVIDYNLYTGRLLTYTQNLSSFTGNETEFKDINIDNSLCKVELCNIEGDVNMAGVVKSKLSTNNKTLDYNNKRFSFDEDKIFVEYISKGSCLMYIVYEDLSEIDLSADILQGTFTKYVNGLEESKCIIDCLEDGSIIINEQTNENNIQNLQQQITELQNIIQTLTEN